MAFNGWKRCPQAGAVCLFPEPGQRQPGRGMAGWPVGGTRGRTPSRRAARPRGAARARGIGGGAGVTPSRCAASRRNFGPRKWTGRPAGGWPGRRVWWPRKRRRGSARGRTICGGAANRDGRTAMACARRPKPGGEPNGRHGRSQRVRSTRRRGPPGCGTRAAPRRLKFIRGFLCRQSWRANAAETTASLRRKPFQATS